MPPSLSPHPLRSSSFEQALAAIGIAFQPIVEATHHTLLGYEALLRPGCAQWPDPGSLLNAAERLNRVRHLGRAVRRQIAARLCASHGSSALIFVNLHALELVDESLLHPASALYQLRERVVLEITERASLECVPNARERVLELRAMGYRIAIDDLGAGHARMNRFTLRDIDFIKLDMALVRDLDRDLRRQRLVSTVIAICRDHDIQVVGEGVETAAERGVLLELGCDLLQGYLIARPGPDLAFQARPAQAA